MKVQGNLIIIDWYGAQMRVFELPTSEIPSVWRHSTLAKCLVPDWFKSLARCQPWDSRDWYEWPGYVVR